MEFYDALMTNSAHMKHFPIKVLPKSVAHYFQAQIYVNLHTSNDLESKTETESYS